METVLSKTGIEVCYPCTIHLLYNGENFECEYKSDHIGRDLLMCVCRIQKISDFSLWGLKYMDTSCMDEQRFWLDLDKLIRTQVKNISPLRFYFRVKVYPPEPYKIMDQSVRHPIFQQLRLDLLGGRLYCKVNEASMLVALVLQHVHGNYVTSLEWMYVMYMKTKVLRKERYTPQFFSETRSRAMDVYKKLLVDLSKLEVEDLFLRLASKLDSYGVEPFVVRNIDKQEFILCINFSGMRLCNKKTKTQRLSWSQIWKITHESKGLFVHLINGGVLVLECVNFSECNYIWSIAVDHLIQYACPNYSTVSVGVTLQDGGSCKNIFHSKFANDAFEEELRMSNCLLQMLDFNSWKSQLSIMYAVILMYFMSTHTSILDDVPLVYSLKNCINKFLSKIIFNKMLTF